MVTVARRHLVTLVVAGILLVNPAVTALLVLKTGAPNLFQLRYNMRVMPLAVIAVGWLIWMCPETMDAATGGKGRRAWPCWQWPYP